MKLASKLIHVDVQDGAATLTGTVSSFAEREAAEQVAWNAPGVTRVDSQLTVVPGFVWA